METVINYFEVWQPGTILKLVQDQYIRLVENGLTPTEIHLSKRNIIVWRMARYDSASLWSTYLDAVVCESDQVNDHQIMFNYK